MISKYLNSFVLPQVSYGLAMSIVQSVVTLVEPRATFLRKQYLSECMPMFILCARDRDFFRQHLMLQLWVNLSAFPNGQVMVVKCITNENIFDLVSEIFHAVITLCLPLYSSPKDKKLFKFLLGSQETQILSCSMPNNTYLYAQWKLRK